MRHPRPLAPKRPRWLLNTAAAVVASFAIYVAAAWWSPWRPGRVGGLVFGTAAALLFLNASLYPLRRRLRGWPWRTAQQWLQLHIYGSVVAAWFVLIHTGFSWPAGTMGWWLWTLSMWTSASGLFGVMLQKTLPPRLADGTRVEAIYESIPGLIERLRDKADALAQSGPLAIAQAFDRDVRPVLAGPRLRWAYVLDVRADRDRQLAPLRDLARYITDEDRSTLDAIESVVVEKLELDAQASVQRVLKSWLVIHVPPAMLLMGLVAVHIGAVLVF